MMQGRVNQRCEATLALAVKNKAIIRKAMIKDSIEELSAPLLKSVLIPFGNFYRPEALTLKVIVERKLKRRVDTHEAKKIRQQKDLHITRIISEIARS